MTTTTQSLSGKRVEVAGRFGQLNGWNQQTGLITLWDEAANEQVTFTLEEGQAPVLAWLIDRNGHETRRLFRDHSLADDEGEADLCADCSRASESGIKRSQTCDWCGDAFAYRNSVDRLNLYLDTKCHALRMERDGISLQQNKWARTSEPLNIRERITCMAAGGVTECKGEVKHRGKTAANLCNAHAGRVSAADGLADREW